jgi:hypothetical protein
VRRINLIPGVGGIAFGLGLFLAMVEANPPGGDYSASDVTNYLDDGHRTAVIISLYLTLIAVAGLICLLAALRDTLAPRHVWAARIFWGSGLAAAAALAIGWAILITPPASLALGGGEAPDPRVTYLITQTGFVVALGAGGLLLGVALIVLMMESGGMLPLWVRVASAIAGLGGLASIAYFPFFLLLVWGLVVGVWIVLSARALEPAAVPRGMD